MNSFGSFSVGVNINAILRFRRRNTASRWPPPAISMAPRGNIEWLPNLQILVVGCDSCGTHERHRFKPSIPSVQPFPATMKIPARTMASADSCPITYAPRAAPLHPVTRVTHWDRQPPNRNIHFPAAAAFTHLPFRWNGLHHLWPAHPNQPAFYAVRVPRCRDLLEVNHLLLQRTFTPKHMHMLGVPQEARPTNGGTGFCVSGFSAWSTAEPYGPS